MDKGDLIGTRYRLDRAIGQGGTGRIWLAQDTRLDRRVAIKFLLGRSAYHRVRYAKRVALEAKIAASIQHPNVVQIFDFGTHADQTPYIVMEALTGFTLGEAFDDARAFSLNALIDIMSEVLRGLAAVHDAGIVHRDLKPENIFLVKESRDKLSPKLLDFGISRSLDSESRRSAVTTTEGLIVGTPQYMSPEQARGDGNIDKRTDIYSIGTILFEALAGKVPFPVGNISQLLIAIVQRQAPPLYEIAPQIGPALCSVVDKALKKDRDERYAHAAEMRGALQAAAAQVPAQFDRSAPLFPPETIRNRAQSKRPRRGDFEDGGVDLDALDEVLGPDPDPLTPATVQHRQRRYEADAAPLHELPDELCDALAAELPDDISVELPPSSVRPTHSPASVDDYSQERGQPHTRALPARYTWTLGAIAFLSLGVAAAAIIVLRDRASAPAGAGMIVVQAPRATPPSSAAQPEPSAPANVTDAPTPAQIQADVEPETEAAPDEPDPSAKRPNKAPLAARSRRTNSTNDPMQAIAAGVASSFSKQKARVIDCLNKHPDEIAGSPQLTVRVALDERGSVTQSELLPQEISGKPVADCVSNAVAKMRFPSPAQPMTFRVPLKWRRK